MTRLIILLTIFLISCKTNEKIQSDYKEVTETIQQRDTTLLVQGSESTLTATVNLVNGLPDLPTQTIENEKQVVTVKIKEGKLKVDCKCKDLELKVKLQDKLIKRLEKQKTEIRVPERYIPFWAKVLAWLGVISTSLLALIVWLRFKIK